MAVPTVLLDGLVFPESPRWYDGRLWLADWGAGEALVVDADGRRTTVAALPSFPSCLDFLSDGRLLLVDSAAGRLLRREPDGALVPHADLSALSPHPWNEVVVDARDRAYVGPGIDHIGEVQPGMGRGVLQMDRSHPSDADLRDPIHGDSLAARSMEQNFRSQGKWNEPRAMAW